VSYKALLVGCRALLRGYRALLVRFGSLLVGYRVCTITLEPTFGEL